jgi:hypothetical protein
MRKISGVLAAICVCILPMMCRGAETNNARLFCLSVQFGQGLDNFGDTMDFSSVDPSTLINGEMFPALGTYSHQTFFLFDDGTGMGFKGVLSLDTPAGVDANGNGFNDFFESSQGVSAPTSGSYSVQGSAPGLVTANWSRSAGSTSGTCSLHFDFGDFDCPFSILEYTGPLSYTPGSNTVSGNIAVTNTADATQQIFGPIAFVKSATNRFNALELQPGGWTNAAMQSLTFTNADFQRRLSWPTNYNGVVLFDDGDPSTPVPDYQLWGLSIDDPNDANKNGIPDFSDDPLSALPRRPLLTLTRGATNLFLSISGDVGRTHQIQQTSSLTITNWQTVQTLTLTNDPQIVALPIPAGGAAFWRVSAQ